MAKKTPPAGIIKEKPKTNELAIHGVIGFKAVITRSGYEISYDQTNEHNMGAFMIVDQVLNDNIEALQQANVYSPAQKKEKAARLEKLRKLKLECINCMAEVATYLLDTKTQEDYDAMNDKLEGKKSKIVLADEKEVKKLILPK